MSERQRWTVESVQVGRPREEVFGGKAFKTAIGRPPVSGPVFLGKLGLVGDEVADPRYHGGPDKAVCVYSSAHREAWKELLQQELPPGAFGENLTVADLLESEVHIGDRFRLGRALVEISQPRTPCRVLVARLGHPAAKRIMLDGARTGFYLRVLAEGEIRPGDELLRIHTDAHRVSVAFAVQVHHQQSPRPEDLDRIRAVSALSPEWEPSKKAP